MFRSERHRILRKIAHPTFRCLEILWNPKKNVLFAYLPCVHVISVFTDVEFVCVFRSKIHRFYFFFMFLNEKLTRYKNLREIFDRACSWNLKNSTNSEARYTPGEPYPANRNFDTVVFVGLKFCDVRVKIFDSLNSFKIGFYHES